MKATIAAMTKRLCGVLYFFVLLPFVLLGVCAGTAFMGFVIGVKASVQTMAWLIAK